MKFIKIINCSVPTYWYADKVGQVIETQGFHRGHNEWSCKFLDENGQEAIGFVLVRDCVEVVTVESSEAYTYGGSKLVHHFIPEYKTKYGIKDN